MQSVASGELSDELAETWNRPFGWFPDFVQTQTDKKLEHLEERCFPASQSSSTTALSCIYKGPYCGSGRGLWGGRGASIVPLA